MKRRMLTHHSLTSHRHTQTINKKGFCQIPLESAERSRDTSGNITINHETTQIIRRTKP